MAKKKLTPKQNSDIWQRSYLQEKRRSQILNEALGEVYRIIKEAGELAFRVTDVEAQMEPYHPSKELPDEE